jgi:adenylate cyclase
VDGLRSVLWYADLRGFTRISDVSSGAAIVEMLNDTFETLTAALRPRGGHVLKFIGDAMLATISFDERDEKAACRRALDAAVEASANLKIRNLEREATDLPFADVDIALHVGEVLYGNVGAVDRLDFTVIGPAVNEVVRMEKLCEPLGQHILFSSRFAEAAGRCDGRLESLGHFQLRGVDEGLLDTSPRLSNYPAKPCKARPWMSAGGFAVLASASTRRSSETIRSTRTFCSG